MDAKGKVDEIFAAAVKGLREEWFNFADDNWYQYVMNLPVHEKVTYLVIILEAQVLNGGFDQYFANRYGIFANMTIESLNLIGAVKKAALLERAVAIVNVDNDSQDVFMQKLIVGELHFFRKDSPAMFILDVLDDEYYAHEDGDLVDMLAGFYQNIGVVIETFDMPELDNKLASGANELATRLKWRLQEKRIDGINIKQEHHYCKEGVQYTVEVIDLMYKDDAVRYGAAEDYGLVLTVSLNRPDQEWALDFSIMRSYGEILHERIIEFEQEEEVDLESIEMLYQEMEDLLMHILVTIYRKPTEF